MIDTSTLSISSIGAIKPGAIIHGDVWYLALQSPASGPYALMKLTGPDRGRIVELSSGNLLIVAAVGTWFLAVETSGVGAPGKGYASGKLGDLLLASSKTYLCAASAAGTPLIELATGLSASPPSGDLASSRLLTGGTIYRRPTANTPAPEKLFDLL